MIQVHTVLTAPFSNASSEPGIQGEVKAINGQLKVYNGNTWIPIQISAWVDSIELERVVEWAKQKMAQELREQALAEQFPAFARAKENYELIKRLVENEVA
jgi:hypothetical protein